MEKPPPAPGPLLIGFPLPLKIAPTAVLARTAWPGDLDLGVRSMTKGRRAATD